MSTYVPLSSAGIKNKKQTKKPLRPNKHFNSCNFKTEDQALTCNRPYLVSTSYSL